MSRHRKKPSASAFSDQQSAEKYSEPTRIPAAEIQDELEEALVAGDDEHALEVLDSAPRWMKNKPEFMLMRASVLLTLGDTWQAFQLFREMERKHPRLTALYLPLAIIYMDQEHLAHALQTAKRAQANRELSEDDRAGLEQIIREATSLIQLLAAQQDLSFETMQRALISGEKAQIAMEEDKLSEADTFFKEAIRIAPNWRPAQNSRARVLFFLGKVDEAISISEAVLAHEAENTFALSSLVIYHIGLGQPDKARDYASRLEKLADTLPKDGVEIERIIMALALLEDTPALWRIAQRYLNAPPDYLISRSWVCLAVAAIRSGQWKDALKLLKKPDEEDLLPAGKELLDELRTVVRRPHPRLAWMPPAYPSVDLLLHPKVINEWEALIHQLSNPPSISQKHKMDGFFLKYPFVVSAMKRLLWDPTGYQMALEFLSEMEREDADDAIFRFATSQTGSTKARNQALSYLIRQDRYKGSKIIKFWNENLEEWQDVELSIQQVGDLQPNARPDTMKLVEKAKGEKDPEKAISLLRQAVEKEPTSPIAIFNLGVMLIQNGREEEGSKLLHRAVEVDPNYTYGHASIALGEANQGNEQEALAHLRVVTQADVITSDTLVTANIAWFLLALDKNDLETARRHFEFAAQMDPDHRLVKHYATILKEAETLHETFGSILEYQRQSIERAYHKLLKTPLLNDMDLRACLETNTKDMLTGSAHFLRISSFGKKGEITARLAGALLDPEFLSQTLSENLSEQEREALQWVLEADGARPWEEFVSKYGSDARESKHWDSHPPGSVPGRLRMLGLFYSGVLEGQTVAFIPPDARPLLHKLFK